MQEIMKWKLEKLGDVFLFIRNGASIKQEDGKGGVPITRIETIANGEVDEIKLGYANIDTSHYLEHYLKENDILMSHINSWIHLGKCALVPKQERDIIHGMNLLLLRPDQKIIHPRFIKHYFGTINFKSQLQ
jgi:type I restriction enzyme S subunit